MANCFTIPSVLTSGKNYQVTKRSCNKSRICLLLLLPEGRVAWRQSQSEVNSDNLVTLDCYKELN